MSRRSSWSCDTRVPYVLSPYLQRRLFGGARCGPANHGFDRQLKGADCHAEDARGRQHFVALPVPERWISAPSDCGIAKKLKTLQRYNLVFREKEPAVGLDRVPSGKDLPNDFNVVIEISMHSEPIKYEVDKESGAIFVDRFMSTAMHYPCNYGYIPHTIAGDGDPVDVLVLSQFALPPGVVVRCRPIGMLKMIDEAGEDAKLLAVPVDKLTPMYRDVDSPRDLPQIVLDQISHFFQHYKDLEPGKFVKVQGWLGIEDAKKEIMDGVAAYRGASEKPAF